MADTLLFRGGSSADIAASTVQNRELVIDTDTDQIVSGASKKKTVMEDSSGNISIAGTAAFTDSVRLYDSTKSNIALTIRESNGYGELTTGSQSNGLRLGASNGNPVEFFISNKTAPYARFDGNGLSIGGTLPSAPSISLNANGSLSANGLLKVDRDTQTIAVFNRAGETRFAVGSDGVYVGTNVSPGGNPVTGNNISLLTDGSATFASDVKIGGTLPASPNITLKADGKVGIKTSNPVQDLDVNGTIRFGAINKFVSATNTLSSETDGGAHIRSALSVEAFPTYTVQGDVDTGVFFPAANNLAVTTGGSERLRIDSSGDVKIGGTLPSAPNISLNADGSAGFGGITTVGSLSTGSTTSSGVRLGLGYAYVQRPAGSISVAQRIYQGSTITYESTADGGVSIGGTIPASPNISLKANGSATFAGKISIDRGAVADNFAYFEITQGGTRNTVITADGSAYVGMQTSDINTAKTIIHADGSAQFGGDITCTDNSKGLILKSPDGTSFRLSVANDGTLSASSI